MTYYSFVIDNYAGQDNEFVDLAEYIQKDKDYILHGGTGPEEDSSKS